MEPVFSSLAWVSCSKVYDELSLPTRVLNASNLVMEMPMNEHSTILDPASDVKSLLNAKHFPKSSTQHT